MGNFEITYKETGEILSEKEFKKVKQMEYMKRLEEIQKKNLKDLTLEEIEIIRKHLKKDKELKLSYDKYGYSIKNNNPELSKHLSLTVRGLIHWAAEHITHEGYLVHSNNRPIKTYKALREVIGITKSEWYRSIAPTISEFNLLAKFNLNGKDLIALNPLYFIKSRGITETMFIGFSEVFEEKLDELDFQYMVKKFGIDPRDE